MRRPTSRAGGHIPLALEAGTLSPWSSRLLKKLGHEVLVADPAALLQKGRAKTDTIDAEHLARWARVDPAALHPIRHGGQVAQADLSLIRVRDALVKARTLLLSCSVPLLVRHSKRGG
jgi:transposase